MSRIYVASSWRNTLQPGIVAELRAAGHEVYDFRNPPNCDSGFSWRQIDPDWQGWSAVKYRELLTTHPIASHGFISDLRGMQWADTCVLVLPCKAADISLSPHLLSRKPIATSSTAKKSAKQRRRDGGEEVEEDDPPPPPTATAKALEYQLIDLMSEPDIDEPTKQSIWALVQYLMTRKAKSSAGNAE